jgi:hypothetical protein
MKTRHRRDRLNDKSLTTLMTNHLRRRYHFSPVVAEALTGDLQAMSHHMHGGSPLAEGQILYPAVKAQEPAGKALQDCEYAMVRLTLFAHSDLKFQKHHNLKDLKKCILARICTEADVQGAPLTHEDLARLLFADRKTIGHYIEELRSEGEVVVTRSTYTDASASISHHRPIVKLFLLRYTETEIAQQTNHTLGRVEAYIKDFLRVSIAHRRGYTLEGVRHLTGLSKRVVEKHLDHYAELSTSSHWHEHLERALHFYETVLAGDLVKKGVLT